MQIGIAIDFYLKSVKKLFILFFVILSPSVFSQPAVQPFDIEVTADMLKWKGASLLPAEIKKSKVLKHWQDEFAEENIAFAELDVNGDNTKEFIIAGSDFPTRGRGFLIIQKTKNGWKNIMQWRGGFIFHRENKPGYSLHVFENSVGNMYYLKLNYERAGYSKEFFTLLPRTIYNGDFLVLWQSLNGMNIF